MLFTIFQSCILFQNCRDFLSHILCFILISCCSIFKDRLAIASCDDFSSIPQRQTACQEVFQKNLYFSKPLKNRRCSFDSFVIVSSFFPVVKRIFKYFPTFLRKHRGALARGVVCYRKLSSPPILAVISSGYSKGKGGAQSGFICICRPPGQYTISEVNCFGFKQISYKIM